MFQNLIIRNTNTAANFLKVNFESSQNIFQLPEMYE